MAVATKKKPVVTNVWDDATLEPQRLIGDPEADAVIADLAASGSIKAVNQLMKRLVENDGIPPDGLPASVRQFLDQSAVLPAWADRRKIKRGEQLFWRHGPQMIVNLFCHSLPFCYAARKGVQVLALTSRLYTNPTRRIIETAQMIVDVMQPGGLGRNGAGIRSCQKVRLMHVGVRHQIAVHGPWDPTFGTPINQEDLGATMLSFSWAIIDGLRRMGHDVSDADAEAYLHCWKVIGHILGVDATMMPTNYADAEAMARAIQQRQYAACPEGRLMTRALIEMMQHHIPGTLFDRVPEILVRFYIGAEYADLLGVKRTLLGTAVLRPLKLINPLLDEAEDASFVLQHLGAMFSRRLIEGLLFASRGGQRAPFSIPTELRQTWGVNWTP